MATRADSRQRGGPTRPITHILAPSELAWLLALPATVLGVAIAIAAARPVGQLLFTGTHFDFWPELAGPAQPKPSELARFVLAVLLAVAFSLAVVLAARRPTRMRTRQARVAVIAAQALFAAALVFCWRKQHDIFLLELVQQGEGGRRIYFTRATIEVAAA
ncbi:MAG: hypothetical protein WBC33_03270, partial [Conexibacter sp.]